MDPSYTGIQVWNEEIWGNLAAIMSIRGQGNGLIGDYMLSTLYARIFLTPYQKPTNAGNNPYYPIGATQVERKIIKDTWDHNRVEFVTREHCQK